MTPTSSPVCPPRRRPRYRPGPYTVLRNFASLSPAAFFLCAFGGLVVGGEVGLDGDWIAATPALALGAFGVAGLAAVWYVRRKAS